MSAIQQRFSQVQIKKEPPHRESGDNEVGSLREAGTSSISMTDRLADAVQYVSGLMQFFLRQKLLEKFANRGAKTLFWRVRVARESPDG